jgi:hypothetical protein
LTYTVNDVENWFLEIEKYCVQANLPLLMCSADNAQPHRDFFEQLLDAPDEKITLQFPLSEWYFQLRDGEFGWPRVGLQDPRHWLRCMIAAITNPKNLIMIGNFPILYHVLADLYESNTVLGFKKEYLKQNDQQVNE